MKPSSRVMSLAILPVLRRKLAAARHLWRADRTLFLRSLRGSCRLYRVFSAPLSQVRSPEPVQGLTVRTLTDTELKEAVRSNPEISYQLEWLEESQEARPYAFYLNGALAHICWLLTPLHMPRRSLRLIPLRPGEIELGHGYTFPRFRGLGLCPLAIGYLCSMALRLGHRRVLVAARHHNVASRRCILKAGLRPCGWILRIIPPLMPSSRGLIIRAFWRK